MDYPHKGLVMRTDFLYDDGLQIITIVSISVELFNPFKYPLHICLELERTY